MKHVQNVMDHSGHTGHEFDAADKVSIAEAQARFQQLIAKGYIAWDAGKNGVPGKQLRVFDPKVETTNFMPALQGG